MAGALTNSLRLAKAGLVLAQHGVRFIPEGTSLPPELRLARALTAPIRWVAAPFQVMEPRENRLAAALTSLGPSYIKLGQFLATRPDVIGPELAEDLSQLQDDLPPFSMAAARRAGSRA
jgi:ubiquinone biosynthesis protein